jgi:hypothetical protein
MMLKQVKRVTKLSLHYKAKKKSVSSSNHKIKKSKSRSKRQISQRFLFVLRSIIRFLGKHQKLLNPR